MPGKHLEMLVLMRMNVGHPGEPARREDAFGREQLAVGVSRRDQEDKSLPGHRILDDVAGVHAIIAGIEADYAHRIGAERYEAMCWALQDLLDDLNGAAVSGSPEPGAPRRS